MFTNKIFREKVVEPVKRNKDGVRWIIHRFPIKGGISIRDAWMADMGWGHLTTSADGSLKFRGIPVRLEK